MERERWNRVKDLCDLALAMDGAARHAYLAAACAGDEELRREVESLLAGGSAAAAFLESPAWNEMPRAPAPDEGPLPSNEPSSLAGRTLGHYRILDQIGRGGMGVVYRAHDTHLDRFVAIKVLPPGQMADPARRPRFMIEAKAASALNHPNIITIHDIGSEAGIDLLVMEHVEGRTLDQLIPPEGMRVSEALKIASQMADALSAAHAAGIAHRDLKPTNVMVTNTGLVKVLDFGLAKLTEGRAGAARSPLAGPATTDAGMRAGTAAYMSPEQAEGRKVDCRSDIFSFGAVLYEMLAGRRAFRSDSAASTIAAVLQEEPPPLADGIPREVREAVARCLRKDPAQRFQRASDLKMALELEARKPHARWPWLAATAALALAAILGWRLPRTGPPTDLKSVPLTAYAGLESEPSLSSDGSKVAFSWNGEQENDPGIYVVPIGSTGGPWRLTTNPSEDRSPAWSPDDQRIAFRRRVSPSSIGIFVVPARPGGQERLVAEIGDDAPDDLLPPTPLSWTPDGKWLAFSAQGSPPAYRAIWAVSPETGERRRLTSLRSRFPDAAGDHSPSISPDGRFLAFARIVGSYVVELDVVRLTADCRAEGEPVRITDRHYASVLGIAWSPDSREVVYSAGGAQTQSLWRVALSGGQPPRELTFALPAAIYPTIARRRSRLVYTWWMQNVNVWRVDTRTGDRKRLLGSTYEARSPQYSPDGRKLAFNSNRSGANEVWTCDADGTSCRQLTFFKGPQSGSPRWSPDSRWLALDSRAEGQSEVYVMPADGGSLRRLTDHAATDAIPSWSGDGQWIYFASDRSGRMEIWKVAAAGGEPVQVTRRRGQFSFQAPGGRDLYYTKPAHPGFFRMPAEGGEETEITRLRAATPGAASSKAVTAKGVYFMPNERTIQFLDAATDRITTVVTLDRPTGALTASPDGAYVAWVQLDLRTRDLRLVEDFR